jgi:carboxyl-terminal processing protease
MVNILFMNEIPTEKRENISFFKRGIGLLLAILLAGGAFFSGLQVGHVTGGEQQTAGLFNLFNSSPEEVADDKPNLEEFWRVWDLMEEKFAVGSTTSLISAEERMAGAIAGMVDSYGDPYTTYFTPEESEAFNADFAGNFSGVGMEVGLRNDLVTIIAPLPDTPAERAGILAGDVIIKIDDKSTEKMTVEEAVRLIRGEKDTVVKLQIFREGEAEFLDISITRDTITIPTVKTEEVGDTFIIALYSFNALAEGQVREALNEYTNKGFKKLILDLRGNPGGYLESAVAIAGYFLPAGKVVVKEQFRDSEQDEVLRSRGRLIQEFNPQNLVVLVDSGSASASEILAGALKDHGLATIIGTQTFGKGSVQELVNIESGSSLKVTVARWLTPNGTSISEGGLEPNIFISRTLEDRKAEVDPQRDAGLDFLAGKTVVSESDKMPEVNTQQ